MECPEAPDARLASSLPGQRGNVSLSNLQVLKAILSVAEHGCKGRGGPRRFGKWPPVYPRMTRWAKNRVLDRVFEHRPRDQIRRITLEAVSLDRTSSKVHPDGTGRENKTAPRPSANFGAAGPPSSIGVPRRRARL